MPQTLSSRKYFDPLAGLKLITTIKPNIHKDYDAQKKFYKSTRWFKLRAIILSRDPVCKMCGNAYSDQVDHIDNNWKNNKIDNLQGLCGSCHSKKTRKSLTNN